MYCMRAELRHMDKTCPGSIVCVSSVQGTFGFAGHAAYSASKHGVLGLVKSEYMYLDKDEKKQNLGYFFRPDQVADAWGCARILIGAAKEVGSRNIRVNAVSEILFTDKQYVFRPSLRLISRHRLHPDRSTRP